MKDNAHELDEEYAGATAGKQPVKESLMHASAWSNGGGTYGIRVGFPNRDRFFDQKWTEIELDIDGDVYRFALSNGFWNRCPEIRDKGNPIIREWLRRHRSLKWSKGDPPRFDLIPLGENRFRLVP